MKIRHFLKNPWVITGLAVALIVAGVVIGGREEKSLRTAVVERGAVIKSVSVNGLTRPFGTADLAFEKTGRVFSVNYSSGASVPAYAVLATLVNDDLWADLQKARAALRSAESTLDQMYAGASAEEIAVYEVKVKNARQNMLDKLREAYTKSDDAVRNQVDQFISNPSTSPQLIFSVTTQLKTAIESTRKNLTLVLDDWRVKNLSLGTESDLTAAVADARNRLEIIRKFLDDVALAVNDLTAASNLSATTIETYKSSVLTARTNVATVAANISIAESTLTVAERELALTLAGSTPEEISVQVAKVAEATANMKSAEAQYEKTILRAPFSGTVGRMDARVGEIVSAGTVIASIVNQTGYEIETFVPEADIAEVKIGDKAEVRFDAFSESEVFSAAISRIDQSATVIEGVSTYKVILALENPDPRIRAGLTAELEIMTARRDDVIMVATRALRTDNGETYVRLLRSDGTEERRSVVAGLRGSLGSTEIISGLSVGDTVILGNGE